MYLPPNFHLTYCTNIHPGEDWNSTFKALNTYLPKIKQGLAPEEPLGIGLRLSNWASEQLGLEDRLLAFNTWLKAQHCYVFTMNGFPFGNFHGQRVKDQVHQPDWTTPERFDYTLRLFKQLSILLPEGMEGGISTAPISYKHWHQELQTEQVFRQGAEQMAQMAVALWEMEKNQGPYLHLDIEPEPDGLLENTADVLQFFETYLVPAAKATFAQKEIDAKTAETLVKKYITVCYDVCHFALAYEEPGHTFTQLKAQHIRVGKVQISAALKAVKGNRDYDQVVAALKPYDEPVYLHQVTQKVGQGVVTYEDLPQFFSSAPEFEEIRAHFHVPIFLEDFGGLASTQDHIIKTLTYLKQHPETTNHLEVETYTWEVLPKSLKAPLTTSVVRELQWVKDHLK
ncbi:MAG: metabolite traffic protein EboE [Bacteroidota bacterium]